MKTSKQFRLLVAILGTMYFVSPVYAQDGITLNQILIGQACALTGPAQGLGQELKTGATAYFEFINSQGGVNGRKIKLISVDDGYEPQRTIATTKQLLEQDKVFILFGYVGTPTSTAAVPLTKPGKVPFFGPFTGAEFLRTPVTENVYNVRASYFQETEAQVHELVDILGLKKIACFYQDDAFGKAGLGGAQKALRQRNLDLVATGTFQRNTVEVQAGLDAVKPASPDAIIMVGPYKPCAAFIKAAKAVGVKARFLNVSFVGSIPLANELGSDGDGVIVTQVVPLPWDASLPLVKDYQAHLKKYVPGAEISFGSLEGYLDAKVLVHALQNAGQNLTRAALIKTLDSMSNAEFGGVRASFSPTDHQGLDQVYLTVIQDGSYKQIKSLKETWSQR